MKSAPRLQLCCGKKCRKRGSLPLMARLGELLADLPELKLEPVGCQERCKHGCVVVLKERFVNVLSFTVRQLSKALALRSARAETKNTSRWGDDSSV